MNIFYYNINYSCNNKCKFCFSHNTYYNNIKNITLEDVQNSIHRYDISYEDRIIVNGGEPTLHPELIDILSAFKSTKAEIIMYSNGRRLINKRFCEDVLSNVDRIVIPIHGKQSIHDKITQIDGAYQETIEGIQNIINGKFANRLELKFIVTKSMIDSKFSIIDFLKKQSIIDCNVVITGVVPTKVANTHKNVLPNQYELGEFISSTIWNYLRRSQGRLKLMDCKLCILPVSMREIIEGLTDKSLPIQYVYYFFDSNITKGRIMSYGNERKCSNCNMKIYCRSIEDSCKVLELNRYEKRIVLE